MPQIILPSLMAKNQKELNQDFQRLEGIVKELHLDVVDGKFAPNKALYFDLRLSKKFTYQAHLMIKNPEKWIKKYLKRIALFIPQFEELKNPQEYTSWMKEKKKKIAFALKPETKVEKVKPYLSNTNYVLILTVHPGFYGSKYLPQNLKKIKKIKKINPQIEIIVDGGMNPQTIKKAAKAGANYFVSGSYTTKADNPKKSIQNLTKAIKKK